MTNFEGDCGRRECDREFREVLMPFRVRFVIISISESGVDLVLRIEKIVVTFFQAESRYTKISSGDSTQSACQIEPLNALASIACVLNPSIDQNLFRRRPRRSPSAVLLLPMHAKYSDKEPWFMPITSQGLSVHSGQAKGKYPLLATPRI